MKKRSMLVWAIRIWLVLGGILLMSLLFTNAWALETGSGGRAYLGLLVIIGYIVGLVILIMAYLILKRKS